MTPHQRLEPLRHNILRRDTVLVKIDYGLFPCEQNSLCRQNYHMQYPTSLKSTTQFKLDKTQWDSLYGIYGFPNHVEYNLEFCWHQMVESSPCIENSRLFSVQWLKIYSFH